MISIKRSTHLTFIANSRRLSTHTMIRRKISTGLLRTSKSTGSLRAVALSQAPVSASTQQSAGLASATLLSSQRNWGKETVVTLKDELRKRGLSQAGTKAVLIDRLESSDTTSILPPMPSSSFAASRKLSTSSPKAAQKKSASKENKEAKVAEETETDAPVVSTGPEVVTQQTEAPKKIEPTPEEISIAPGLPATKATDKTKKNTINVRIPTPEATREIPQNIPVEPDNFRAPPAPKEEPESSTPKVVTVASAATHTAGGPTHALHETVDPHKLEEAQDAVKEGVKEGVESLSSVISSALAAPGKALKSSGLPTSLPTIGAPKGFEDSKHKEYKPSDKKLNDEEKRGLWVLGGIVGFGLIFGGGKKEKKSKNKGNQHDSHDASANGVKGDAAWEKASGAGIVGHGTRKD